MTEFEAFNKIPRWPREIIIHHVAAKQYFKKTILHDEAPKGTQ